MIDNVTDQPITFTNASPLHIDANVANYVRDVKPLLWENKSSSPLIGVKERLQDPSPERNLFRMRSDLSEASSVMVGGECAGAREWSTERERVGSWCHTTRRNGLLSFCLSLLGEQEEAGEGERQMLVNPLMDTNRY